MKKLRMFAVLVALSFLLGCAPAIQIGAGLAGEGVGRMLEESYNKPDASAPVATASTRRPGLIPGNELARHEINQFEIRVNEGFYGNDPCVIFTVFENFKMKCRMTYLKSNPEDLEKIESYWRMTSAEKKQFIKADFLKYNFDLGPVESETAEKPSSPSYQNIPTTGFAPKIR